MVLTNFECWAHGGAAIGNVELPVNSRHMDMFNPRGVQQRLNIRTGTSSVSHISSNGYYGFSYVNAAHELGDNYHHNDVTHDPNNTNINNNNNNICVPNANNVNGMDVGGATDGTAAVFGSGLNATRRCKKRYFVSDDDYTNCALLNGCDSGVGVAVAVAGLEVRAPKRCRFDDDYAAAQYCNGNFIHLVLFYVFIYDFFIFLFDFVFISYLLASTCYSIGFFLFYFHGLSLY